MALNCILPPALPSENGDNCSLVLGVVNPDDILKYILDGSTVVELDAGICIFVCVNWFIVEFVVVCNQNNFGRGYFLAQWKFTLIQCE